MRVWVLAAVLMCPIAAAAQDRAATLADIRLQLRTLSGEITGLERELQPSGTTAPGVSGSTLQRVDGMEAELRRLTALTEELEYRIRRIVEDGTNRIGDLEFRLVELEGGDIGQLGATPPLGGQTVAPAVMMPPAPETSPELAVGESRDYETAINKLESGDSAGALADLDRFLADYPRSPLAAAAQLARGRAYDAQSNSKEAGRAFLEAFTLAEETDPVTASAGLLGLGQSLASLGQTREACLTLSQVGVRFPGMPAVAGAEAALAAMDCP